MLERRDRCVKLCVFSVFHGALVRLFVDVKVSISNYTRGEGAGVLLMDFVGKVDLSL